jgi:hypothetical protein
MRFSRRILYVAVFWDLGGFSRRAQLHGGIVLGRNAMQCGRYVVDKRIYYGETISFIVK